MARLSVAFAVAVPVYDSARKGRRALAIGPNVWQQRRLVGLLLRRDLVSRYKRSLLGMWWTLLNPLLEMAVFFIVFSHIFRRASPGVPYVVYLLSGLVLINLFRQTVLGVATSMINNGPILSRMYVPIEVFAVSAAGVLLVNFLASLIPLLAFMLITGTALPATLPLVIIPGVLIAFLGVGIGLALAPAAVLYPDVTDLLSVALLLSGYLVPVFYPFSIVPAKYRLFEKLNPLYHFLESFRGLLYGGSFHPASAYAVMVGTAAAALIGGSFVFSRFGRRMVVLL